MWTIILTVAAIVVFFALMVGIGFFCRKRAMDVNGFVLGGRQVGPWLTAFAFGTSYFSAVIFVGYAGQFGWNFGLASTWIGLGNAFIGSLMAWRILGRRTRVMTQHLDSRTMPDFFEKRYDSPALKIAASLIVFVFLIPYTASLYNGLSSLFSIAFDIPYWVVILIMASLTGVYVIVGGYMASAVNDFIQGIIMLVGIVAVIIAVLMENGGLMDSVQQLAERSGWEYTSVFGPNPEFLFFVVILTSLGTWGLPQMVGKFYAIKNEGSIKKGTIISTVFAVVVAGGCYFLGGFGRLFLSESEMGGSFDSIIPTMISRLQPALIALTIVLVLSASMSTLSSLVLTSSSTLVLDVILPSKKKAASERKKIGLLRLMVVFFILVSGVLAYLKDRFQFAMIAQMMGVSWGALAGAFLAPFLYGLYWRKVTRTAVGVNFVYAVSLEVIQLLISLKVLVPQTAFFSFIFRNSLYSGVFAMVGGLILVPVVSLLTPKKHRISEEKVNDMFAGYERKISVNAKNNLGQ